MKILVLDTETLGVSDRRIYDIGWVLYDAADGNILKSKDYVIKQVYDNPDLMNSAYYKKKLPIYEQRIADGYAKKVFLGNALRYLARDIAEADGGIYAYNSKFDYNAIKDSVNAYKSKVNPTADGILDIMDYIDSITETEAYEKFCNDNNFKTKHRPPKNQKKAETLYRYMTNQTDYEEQHTALEDSKIELEILKLALGLK